MLKILRIGSLVSAYFLLTALNLHGQEGTDPNPGFTTSGRDSAPIEHGAVPDTLRGISEVTRILRDHYGSFINSSDRGSNVGVNKLPGWAQSDLLRDPYCDGDNGDICHDNDPDNGPCRNGSSCHPTEEFLLEVLTEAATEYPTSGFILGQAIYALTKFNQPTRAQVIAHQCEASEWLCSALKGYVLYSQGNFSDAEPHLRQAMSQAPIPVICAFGDPTWLMGEWDQRFAGIDDLPDAREATLNLPCLDKLEIADTLFWWADPLYSVEGNERWVAHIGRALGLRFYREMRGVLSGISIPQRYLDYDWASRIRRGVWDSYRVTGDRFISWTSDAAAQYGFFPKVETDDLSNPTWDIHTDLYGEGFSPPYGPFFEIPVQIARFRVGDTLWAAIATRLIGTPIGNASSASAHFFLTDGPGSLPIQLSGDGLRARPVFIGQAPMRDYVASMEVISPEGIGWHREKVASLEREGPELSDLLLFRPSAQMEPDSIMEAVALMFGSSSLDLAYGLGVYWETYGAPSGTNLEFELSFDQESGSGLRNRITRILPGGSEEGFGTIRWTEEASASTHSGTVSLDVSNLDPGEYDLILKVRWDGQEEIQRHRRVSVRNSG